MNQISYRLGKLVLAFLIVFPATLSAQTFTDNDAWRAATCGQIVEDEIIDRITEYMTANGLDPNVDDVSAIPLSMPTDLGWGTFTSFGFGDNAFFNFASVNSRGFIIDEREFNSVTNDLERTFYLDPEPALGAVEGFSFHYGSEGFNIDIYDGTTLVESLHAPDSGGTDFADFGWINTNGINITRLEIYSSPDNVGGNTVTFISGVDFSFGQACPPNVSFFDQLTDIKVDVEDLLALETGADAYYGYYYSEGK